MRTLFLVLGSVALLGCKPAPDTGGASAPAPCVKVGDRCQFAPGKLGTCVARDDCASGDCLVCQSQH